MEIKVCSKCKRGLPANSDHFFRRKESKDGLQGVCKECRSGHSFTDKIKYKTEEGFRICLKCDIKYQLNNENFYASNLNKEGFRTTCKVCDNQTSKLYKENNKNKTQEQWKLWYEENKEYKNEYDRNYRAKNLVRINEYNIKYQKKYRQSKRGKAIRSKHYHIRQAKIKNLQYNFTEDDWFNCKKYFDLKCAYCGCEPKVLTQDHFVALNNGGDYTVHNIIPCCFSCNSSKQDKDFYKWYESKDFYNRDRVDKIHRYFNEVKL